jgi:molybdopterin converting factor small subunit
MIAVKMMPILAKRSSSRQEQLAVEFAPGLTPGAVAEAEGFHGPDLEAILAIVNGTQVELDAPLADGDALELMVGIAGG